MNRVLTFFYYGIMVVWIGMGWMVFIPGVLIGLHLGAWQHHRLILIWAKVVAFIEMKANDQAERRQKK